MLKYLEELVKTRKKLYFLHIPKTSGTSTTAALNQIAIQKKIKMLGPVLLDHLIENPKWTKSDILVGHLGLLPLNYIYEYFTILRDPLERLYSHYSHIKRSPGHYLHNVVAGEELDFENYLLDKRLTNLNFNMQTRYLSCTPVSDNLDKKGSHQEKAQIFENSDASNVNLGIAIGTLTKASWVGTTNDLNPLILFLEKRFGLTNIEIPFIHVRPGPKKIFSSREITAAEPLIEFDKIIFKYWNNSP
jgi:hypothetical protein